ncbi:MAG: hypothetical protein GAK45_01049 [Pseudomonas citronellolis]|nr:MAG: hypothetical protein GAK45_01049 [Pseudomonas citronellolis]
MHSERLARLYAGEAMHLVDAHRVALLGHEQATAIRIVGQPLETLVAVQTDAQRELFHITGIEVPGIRVQHHAKQPLTALVTEYIDIATDVLDGLGITKAGQVDTPQHLALQRQFDDPCWRVGHREQAAPVRVVGQRRDIVIQALDRLCLDHHTIVRQPQRTLTPGFGIPPFAHREPAALEQAPLLASPEQPGKQWNQ